MRVYLDLCCLKRPFDLQEQPLIRLQTEAVLSILALPADTVELLRSQALVLENNLNPNQARREAVALWLSEAVAIAPNEADLSLRVNELVAKGFRSFDACICLPPILPVWGTGGVLSALLDDRRDLFFLRRHGLISFRHAYFRRNPSREL